MKKSTKIQLNNLFYLAFNRNPRPTQWNIKQEVTEGNEMRFFKKMYNSFRPLGNNKMLEFQEFISSKISM